MINPKVRPKVRIRASVTESQAEALLKPLLLVPFNIEYAKEQHDDVVVLVIDCTVTQGKIIREILYERGALIGDSAERSTR